MGKNGELEQKSQEDMTEDNLLIHLGKLNDQPSNALHTSGVVPQKKYYDPRAQQRTCTLLGPDLSILYMYILYSTKSALPGTETPASHEQKVDSQVRHNHTISQPTQREPTPGTCPMTR